MYVEKDLPWIRFKTVHRAGIIKLQFHPAELNQVIEKRLRFSFCSGKFSLMQLKPELGQAQPFQGSYYPDYAGDVS